MTPFHCIYGGVLFAILLNSSSVNGNNLRIAAHAPPGVVAAVVASEPNSTRAGSRLIAAAQRRALSGVGGSPSVVASKYRLRVRGSFRATASTKT